MLSKILYPHILPLNFLINRRGNFLVTQRFYKTVIINIEISEVINIWEVHKNVIYWIAINKQFESRLATGSFYRTARIWEFSSGKLIHILEGHK